MLAASSSCGCCEGVEKLTPMMLANRPGLSALSYRAGTYAKFFETMVARLSNYEIPTGEFDPNGDPILLRPLTGLTTREQSDPAIALLDAWALVADVLTFYDERIANEGYLRTATERRSVLELARLIGYAPRPGVSATAWFAYTIDEDRSVTPPKGMEVTIPAGSRAQSVPEPGELPQPFETAEPLRARTAWNTLKPRMSRPQTAQSRDTPLHQRQRRTPLPPVDLFSDFVKKAPSAPASVVGDSALSRRFTPSADVFPRLLTAFKSPAGKGAHAALANASVVCGRDQVYALRGSSQLMVVTRPPSPFSRILIIQGNVTGSINRLARNTWGGFALRGWLPVIALDAEYERIRPESLLVIERRRHVRADVSSIKQPYECDTDPRQNHGSHRAEYGCLHPGCARGFIEGHAPYNFAGMVRQISRRGISCCRPPHGCCAGRVYFQSELLPARGRTRRRSDLHGRRLTGWSLRWAGGGTLGDSIRRRADVFDINCKQVRRFRSPS